MFLRFVTSALDQESHQDWRRSRCRLRRQGHAFSTWRGTRPATFTTAKPPPLSQTLRVTTSVSAGSSPIAQARLYTNQFQIVAVPFVDSDPW